MNQPVVVITETRNVVDGRCGLCGRQAYAEGCAFALSVLAPDGFHTVCGGCGATAAPPALYNSPLLGIPAGPARGLRLAEDEPGVNRA